MFVLFGRIACIVPNDTGIIRNDFSRIVPNECDSNVRNNDLVKTNMVCEKK